MNKTLILNDRTISYEEIINETAFAESEFEESTLSFCRQWLNEQTSYSLKTSGSTGNPKTITVSRDQMIASAEQTINFFQLSPADTVLVCLNTAYIAGKMMLVRAFHSGAKIIVHEPSGNPLESISTDIDFIALVPLQLHHILSEPVSKSKLELVRATIVGGAPVTYFLDQQIQSTTANVWATFGMTETITHFALKKLNPEPQETFTILNNTAINVDDRGCLIVSSPVTNNQSIITNDRVEIVSSNEFKWLGRIDHVINTGGIKLQVEQLEKKVEKLFFDLSIPNSFLICAIPDPELGDAVCLVVEALNHLKMLDTAMWEKYFDKYERPRFLKYLPEFHRTPTGKIDRRRIQRIILEKT